ncbi:MAG: dephospho-CoA kinase [Alphaproteobacteria bacterium]
MIIIGLTGSIAMGKTTVCNILKQMGLPVFESDFVVHKLFNEEKSLINNIKNEFPEAVFNNKINRKVLGEIVFNNKQKRIKLEKLVHPLVKIEMDKFLNNNKLESFVILDIPLLYEAGWDKFCDKIMVVSCFSFMQYHRVMLRKNMTFEKFLGIKQRQLPNFIKKRKADIVINTNCGIKKVEYFLKKLKLKGFKN